MSSDLKPDLPRIKRLLTYYKIDLLQRGYSPSEEEVREVDAAIGDIDELNSTTASCATLKP